MQGKEKWSLDLKVSDIITDPGTSDSFDPIAEKWMSGKWQSEHIHNEAAESASGGKKSTLFSG